MKRFSIQTQNGRGDEDGVRKMYEFAPYPDLGMGLKDATKELGPLVARHGLPTEGLAYLEAGCGTGHRLVATAKAYPGWRCCGLDLSQASLDVARTLGENHGVQLELQRGSYLEPLPFEPSTFNIISAMGTVHHCAEPREALARLRDSLAPGGILLLHMYGWRLDRPKFETKEMLSLLEPDLFMHERRFSLYRDLMNHRKARWGKRILETSPMDVFRRCRAWWRNRRRRKQNVVWSPAYTETFSQISAPWIDHFCHPCERAYEIPELQELVEGAGLEVLEMKNQGREEMHLLPPSWRASYQKLPAWDRFRMMELLSPTARSFFMVLKAGA